MNERALSEKIDWVTLEFAPTLSDSDLSFLVQSLTNLLKERESKTQ